jgi:hypothetical protein
MMETEEQKVRIVTAGRRDLGDLFRIHISSARELPLAPLLVFVEGEDGVVRVRIVKQPAEMLNHSDATPVMAIWPGKHRSDYFQFTVGEYREFLNGGPDVRT